MSFTEKCPKCDSEMHRYSDYKPTTYESGECLECGYSFYTKDEQLTLKDINDTRIDMDLKPLKKLKKQTA